MIILKVPDTLRYGISMGKWQGNSNHTVKGYWYTITIQVNATATIYSYCCCITGTTALQEMISDTGAIRENVKVSSR
jgi:hypothetical protein